MRGVYFLCTIWVGKWQLTTSLQEVVHFIQVLRGQHSDFQIRCLLVVVVHPHCLDEEIWHLWVAVAMSQPHADWWWGFKSDLYKMSSITFSMLIFASIQISSFRHSISVLLQVSLFTSFPPLFSSPSIPYHSAHNISNTEINGAVAWVCYLQVHQKARFTVKAPRFKYAIIATSAALAVAADDQVRHKQELEWSGY